MENKKNFLIIVIAFVVLIIGASGLYNYLGDKVETNPIAMQEQESESVSNEETKADNPAPDFTVVDKSGKEYKLSDFEGKPTILNFGASWCGPCKNEMPDFDEAYVECKDKINFLMVNLTDGSRETVETASDYIKKQGYSFPVYYDTQSDAVITYSVYSVPTTYFIDEDGNIIANARGAIDKETLQKGIDMIYLE